MDKLLPAFPTDPGLKIGSTTYHFPGMSMRDYLAAKAMQGIMANPDHTDATQDDRGGVAGVAKHAYRVADAMLIKGAKP